MKQEDADGVRRGQWLGPRARNPPPRLNPSSSASGMCDLSLPGPGIPDPSKGENGTADLVGCWEDYRVDGCSRRVLARPGDGAELEAWGQGNIMLMRCFSSVSTKRVKAMTAYVFGLQSALV